MTVAFVFFVVAEYGVWIGMLVYAYQHGGATAAGLVAVVQLLPGVFLAPLVAGVADRRSPTTLLMGGYLVQALGMAGVAVAIWAGASPLVAYVFAVVSTTAMCVIRPAHFTLLPAVARDAQQLTAVNLIAGWGESGGMVGGAVLASLFLDLGHVGLLFAVTAGLVLTSALLVAPVRVLGIAVADGEDAAMGYSEWFEGLRAASGDARSRLLVGLIAAQFVVEGALDVLLVVIAIRVLEESQGWVGYLNTAYGIGGVVAGILTARLIWGRLGHLIGFAVAVLGVSLALTAFSHIAVLTLVLLAAVGAGRAVLSVSVNTLLQRVVPVHVLGRVFGLVEGLSNAGLALGAALAPLLINLGGYRIAVVTVGFLLPVVVVIGINTLRRLDDGVRVPVVEVALLRSLPHFAELPVTALETLAESADHVEAGPGAVIIRQGEQGDRFYAIVDGNVTVSVDGRLRNSMSRGQGIGEIALLRCSPRTATVTAVDSVSLLALESASFLAALSGHAPTRRRVDDVAQRLNSADVIDLR